jgi:two-component system phosphate regulon response regulator OmpR
MAALSPGVRAGIPHLLVVDDDRETRDLLSMYFREQGFGVDTVKDGPDMDAWLARNTPDLVILDLMLPGEDGLSLARRLRADHKLPIVMISARGEEIDRIVGLEVGADDYVPKPFNPRELLARVRAVLRRSSRDSSSEQGAPGSEFGPFRLDTEKRILMKGVEEVGLSRAEFDLLGIFVGHPNRVLSRDAIMDQLGGRDRDPFDRSIDVRVTRLRHKIEEDPARPRYIRTVWGVGYQFTPTGPRP